MRIAILPFQGFNELDSRIALGIPNRIRKPAGRVTLRCPEPMVISRLDPAPYLEPVAA